MDCTTARISLSAWLDGELSPQEEQELQAHLAECPQCRALQEEFLSLSALLREAPAPAVPPALKAQVMANLPPQEKAGPKVVSIHWKRWGAMAAAAALVIAAAIWFRFPAAVTSDSSDSFASVKSEDPATAPENSSDVTYYQSAAPTSESVLTAGAVEEYATDIAEVPVGGEVSESKLLYRGTANGAGETSTDTGSKESAVMQDAAAPDTVSDFYAFKVNGVAVADTALERSALFDKQDSLLESEAVTAAGAPLNLAPGGGGDDASAAVSSSESEVETPESLQKIAAFSQVMIPADDLEEVLQLPDTLSFYCSVLTIPSARDGLLRGYYFTTREDGAALYRLPAAQFDTLVSELSQSEVEYTLKTSGEDVSPSAPYGLVIILAPMD